LETAYVAAVCVSGALFLIVDGPMAATVEGDAIASALRFNATWLLFLIRAAC
jgi:hypothetical protein